SRSTASTPTPPPLVNIASRLPGNGRTRPSVSAAANSSSRSSTPQQAGAAERGVIDRVSTGERPGMRLRRLRPLHMPARLAPDHGLDARGGARRRHEFARVVDRLDVEENCPGRAIEREEIEQVAEIDVDLVPERDGRREADVVRRRPLDEARGDGAGL